LPPVEQFRALDMERVYALMACPIIVELRNIYPPQEVTERGFAYNSIGRSLTFKPAYIQVPPPHAPSPPTADAKSSRELNALVGPHFNEQR